MSEQTIPIQTRIQLGPLILKNPVTVASGTFGYGAEFMPFFNIGILGGIVVKGIHPDPRSGHPQPRLVETASGMLNCIGLQNVGVDAFIRDKLPLFDKLDTACIVNINGNSIDEYVSVAEKLTATQQVDALEINVSCPNVSQGGIVFGIDPVMTEKVTRAVRERTHLPLIVKLSPNVTDITAPARAAMNGGADVLSLINTLVGMAIDPIRRRPILSNITGGLSGPAIKPIALRCVWQVHRAVPLPIIGMGGISTGLDAIEFMLAGAAAISVGTANFVDPCAAQRILDEMVDYCRENAVTDIRTLTGALEIDHL
ncbi:dihydroorotate dehydrogenase [bacterium]|nr:dihydroorotate dehydrogenase [candidate division CSSED10-310 bacterium]